jgi:Flp pilus assembly pilin Flp
MRIHTLKEPAQNLVEYGLIVAVIAVVILIGTTMYGGVIAEWFMHLVTHITTNGT